MFSQIGYLISESFRSLKQHRTVILPSLVTIFLCSLLLSASMVTLLGVFRVISVEKSLYTVEAFLKDSVSEDSVASIKSDLYKIKWVDSVEYVSASAALEDFKKHFSEEMLSLVSDNPLPASFRLTLQDRYKTPYYLNTLSAELNSMSLFDAVQAPVEWVERISSWKFSLLFWPFSISFLLLTTLSLIIGNSVRLSLFSRKLLVENMKYAGGSSFFIVFPFVLEGLIQGLVGSLLSVFFFIFLFNSLQNLLPVAAVYLSGYGWMLFLVVLLVTFLSVYFSWRSVHRFLLSDRAGGT
ncbi:MAG: cell division protein [Fibrobacter sp.]|nr:cell division protein [Fibrobacter sp.]